MRVGPRGIQLFDAKRYILILFFFLFLFPKGGLKAGEVPLTWGYILLGPIALGALFIGRFKIQKARAAVLLYLLPFQIVGAITMILSGVDNTGMALSFWISFFFLPYCFMLLFSQVIDEIDTEWFFSFFKRGMLFLAIYGIVAFVVRGASGKFIEIPLLTTNLGDFGEMSKKCNDRGLFAKLISTYNNGNLFGACMVMLLPLYCHLEKSSYRQWIVKLALFLTLSRTVWMGLFFSELTCLLVLSKDKAIAILKISTTFVSFLVLLCAIALYIGFPITFFLDARLGGRIVFLEKLGEIGFFSGTPFSGIVEMVYIGVAQSLGWAGLVTFLIAMCAPPFLQIITHGHRNPLYRVIGLGLLNYLFICCSDGAILYLPTMVFYWFLVSLLFRKSFLAPPVPALP